MRDEHLNRPDEQREQREQRNEDRDEGTTPGTTPWTKPTIRTLPVSKTLSGPPVNWGNMETPGYSPVS